MQSVTQNYYCDIMKKFTSFIGQWPYQRRRTRLFRLISTIMVLFGALVPQVTTCKYVYCRRDIQCILGTTPSYVLMIVILMKILALQFNNDKIKDLTERFVDNWEKLNAPEERRIMTRYAVNVRRVTLVYSLSCFLGCFVFMLVSFVPRILDVVLPLNESRPVILPYEAYYFIDERKYFYYILCQAFVIGQICIITLIAYDCIVLTYAEHVCSVFAVAGYRFEHSVYNNTDVVKMSSTSLDDLYCKKIESCLHAHWMAIKFAELLENTFSLPFTLLVALCTVGLSITLLQIVMQSNEMIEAMRYSVYIFLQLVHLFVFSFLGQRLIDHSLQIRDKIYNCSWYNLSAKSQRLLLHVMKRSLRPNYLSASKIYIFSLQSFTTIVQTSVSYFTVLSSRQ